MVLFLEVGNGALGIGTTGIVTGTTTTGDEDGAPAGLTGHTVV